MSVKLITNLAWRDAAQLIVTDAADTATSDSTNIENIACGPRHLEWAQTGTAVRRLVYLDKRGGLEADTFVGVRADRWLSGYNLRRYAAYPGTPTLLESSATPPTLIGMNGDDYVTNFTPAVGQQAFSLEVLGAFTKKVNKLCFGTAIEFLYPGRPTIVPLGQWDTVQIRRRVYKVCEQLSWSFELVSKAQITKLESQWKINEEPCFLWDADRTLLETGLWHCIIPEIKKTQTFDDQYSVSMQAFRLREYPLVA